MNGAEQNPLLPSVINNVRSSQCYIVANSICKAVFAKYVTFPGWSAICKRQYFEELIVIPKNVTGVI